MTPNHGRASDWDILDGSAVEDMRARAADPQATDISADAALSRAEQLSKWAVAGNLPAIQSAVDSHRQWAAQNGLRRIENALIELDRVVSGTRRGQAILQAQALTRFIARHIRDDIAALQKALRDA